MSDLPITVVIPVKNEERNLARCLPALVRFRHVIVVDSMSSDRTAEVARSFSAEVIQFEWNGKFPKKRNWILINRKLPTEWVLFLDADEILTDAFCHELELVLSQGKCDGYWLRYTNYFLGKKLRFGVPQRKLALFRVGAGLYEAVDEEKWSHLDMEVHEHPVIKGVVDEIKSPIEHNDYNGLTRFLDRHVEYVCWEARRVENMRSRGNAADENLTFRQSFKYRHIDAWWYPWIYFIYSYIVRGGFRDGAPGFYYAFFKLWYFVAIRLEVLDDRDRNVGRVEKI